MNFTRSPPASLQLVFDISKVRFNRPGYFFLKLTAQNGAPSVRQDGDTNNDDVWVKMPELSNCFMHAYSRINDPVKQKDPNVHVAVSDGQFTFFMSRGRTRWLNACACNRNTLTLKRDVYNTRICVNVDL